MVKTTNRREEIDMEYSNSSTNANTTTNMHKVVPLLNEQNNSIANTMYDDFTSFYQDWVEANVYFDSCPMCQAA